MKLRNKKTGEIGWLNYSDYYSLAELNEEWEDYEEPIDFWTINLRTLEPYHVVDEMIIYSDEMINNLELVGLKFETKEEAEKAVEELKAWKRLKDEGIIFKGKDFGYNGECYIRYELPSGKVHNIYSIDQDLNLLFGGEE